MRAANVCLAVVPVLLGGCAASIQTALYDPQTASDRIVYRLPERQYAVTVVYELVECDAEPTVRVESATIDSTLAPTESTDYWFTIDPRAFDRFLSSVDPATIELDRGMLTTVGLKTTGALQESIGVVKELASMALAETGSKVTCTEEARKALRTVAGLEAALKPSDGASSSPPPTLADELAIARAAFMAAPTQDNARRLDRLAAEASAVAAKISAVRDQQLRLSWTFRLAPASSAVRVEATVPHAALAQWFDGMSGEAAAGHAGDAKNAEAAPPKPDFALLDGSFKVSLVATLASTPPVSAAKPTKDSPFDGLYYRRPALADVIVAVAGKSIVRQGESLPQFGALQRVEMRGTVLGTRNVSVSFDAHGDLKKYEFTSKGMAAALAGTIKDARSAVATPPAPTELQQLTADVELLKKKKELIELKRALEALEATAPVPTTTTP